ncbi:MAG: DUF885 domain-containing protein [Gammaproteobacteria bacterium]
MKKYILLTFVLIGCSQTDDALTFNQIIDSEWQRGIENNPIYASSIGDLRFNQDWADNSIDSYEIKKNHDQKILELINALDVKDFNKEDKLNYLLFLKQYQDQVTYQEFDLHLMPFSHRGGIQLEHETVSILPFRTQQHYLDWIERLKKLPQQIDNVIVRAELGILKEMVPPKILMTRVHGQLKLQAETSPTDSPFYKIFSDIDLPLTDIEKKELQTLAKNTIRDYVIPAYQKLLLFFENSYLPASRNTIGISHIPNGKTYYEFAAKRFTTTNLTPLEIHNIGLAEVARIRNEMQLVMDQVKWKGSFKEFLDDLRSNPKFYFDDPNDLFTEYLATSKRIDPELVHLFKKLPSMPYGLKPIPDESAPDTTTAYYQRPAADGSRAGYYYVNLYKPEVRPKYEIEVLSVHEAVPGHHLQISLAMELDLPNFRKYGGFTAFVEGWGLYSESLGYDMGLYKDPYSKFGQLTYDMWRAIRLVVDTGMHYFDWSRQDAINYFLENSAKTKQDIINEVDRYINWPGQALAYKIGQLKILELKNKSKDMLGDQFDIKDFHHEILKNGALPLQFVEQNINEWIEIKLSTES